MSAPKVNVPLDPPIDVVFSMATLIRIERQTGKTPVALINGFGNDLEIPETIERDKIREWLDTPAGKAASAKSSEKISAVRVVDFIAMCTGCTPDEIAEKLPLDKAYSTYMELQSAMVDATRTLLASKSEPVDPPQSAG